MVNVTKEESKFEVLKPDVYVAEYKGCQETQILNKKTNEMDRVLKHYWEVVSPSGVKIELNEISDTKMTGKNKLNAIIEALVGKEIPNKETINTDTLVGKKARLTVKNKKVGEAIYNVITDHLAV